MPAVLRRSSTGRLSSISMPSMRRELSRTFIGAREGSSWRFPAGDGSTLFYDALTRTAELADLTAGLASCRFSLR